MDKKISTERSQPTLWQNLSDIEQESLSGGRRKVEAIIRPFKLDEVKVR